MQGQQPVA